MNRLMIGTRYPAVTMVLGFGIALLALAVPANQAAAATLEESIAGQEFLCKMMGGTPETEVLRNTAQGRMGAIVTCIGSVIGGYECSIGGNNDAWNFCYPKAYAPLPEDIHVAPGGGIEDLSDPGSGGHGRIGGIAVQPGSVEDPTGDAEVPIERQVSPADQVGACEVLGGTASLIDQPGRPVGCTGGVLDGMDGMICYGTICDYFRSSAGSEDDPSVTPTGGMLVVSVAPGDGLGETTGASVTPVVAEDPSGETMVILNQSGPTLDEKTKGQAAFCRALGGTSTTIERASGVSVVECEGGLLDGMTCFNAENATNCMFVTFVVPQDPQVTPAAGIEAPAEDAPTATTVTEPPVAPTEVPVEPSIVPTDVPAEPTAAPTGEPVRPTVPTDDNTAPPGEVEDSTQIEPTPTEVILQ